MMHTTTQVLTGVLPPALLAALLFLPDVTASYCGILHMPTGLYQFCIQCKLSNQDPWLVTPPAGE
jgi:hypothetical protein